MILCFHIFFKARDGAALFCDSIIQLIDTILLFCDVLTCNTVIHLLELFLQKEAIIHRGMTARLMRRVGILLLARYTITLATEVVDIQLPEPIAKRTDSIVADSLDVPILDS